MNGQLNSNHSSSSTKFGPDWNYQFIGWLPRFSTGPVNMATLPINNLVATVPSSNIPIQNASASSSFKEQSENVPKSNEVNNGAGHSSEGGTGNVNDKVLSVESEVKSSKEDLSS